LVRLLSRDPLSPSVCAYRFRVEGEGPFVWAPGQYVELFAPSAPDLPLPYSIASAPDARAPGEFELAIGTGSGRELLAPLPIGAELQVAGPFGRMIWSPSGSSALLVGAGTGVAPLRALLQARLDGGDGAPIVLFAGFRERKDILWREELEGLVRRYAHFRFLCTLTQPDETWSGLRGRVQQHVVSLARELRDPSVFLCGAKAMVEECGRLLIDEALVPPGRILAEGY
jgi:NAD(P)H-flavin reductase